MIPVLTHLPITPPADNRLAVVTLLAINRDDIPSPPRDLFAGLDDDERARAETFRRDVHRRRFIRRRWWRRQVIAALADVPAATVHISHDRLGQPSITTPATLRGWHISTSHSDVLAVLAVSRSRPVGIDVALHDPRHVTDEAARTFLADAEYDDWLALPEPQRMGAFYRSWTRKEAALKVTGTGFAIEPRLVNVRCDLVSVADVGDIALWDVPVLAGWSGALAVTA